MITLHIKITNKEFEWYLHNSKKAKDIRQFLMLKSLLQNVIVPELNDEISKFFDNVFEVEEDKVKSSSFIT